VLGMSARAVGVGCHDPSRIVTVRNTAPLIEGLQVRFGKEEEEEEETEETEGAERDQE
jgi:hypothetical protein